MIGSLFLACSLVQPVPAPPQKKADAGGILLISLDTLRADRLGVYGNPKNLTPNLDHLAQQSIVFENAYAQSNETLLVMPPFCRNSSGAHGPLGRTFSPT